MSAAGASIPFNELINGPHVQGRLYRDPDLFARELEAIWYKVWVYIGHESEIPQPGDFVRRQIGLQPVIMIRDDDGRVGVLFNRCRHRGNLVCQREHGNVDVIRCPYHGWTYERCRRADRADLRGRLRRESPPRGFALARRAARRFLSRPRVCEPEPGRHHAR